MTDAATLRDALPALYRGILPALFERESLPERRATCDDCAMCGDSGAAVTFLPSTKCCTFEPQLPNYLVGALLADVSPALEIGRSRVRARMRERSRVTPRWLAPSRRSQVLYQAVREAAFGRSEALRCPYYDDGRCSIWRYRESYCSTFFCKHEQGEDGRQFWRNLRVFLSELEQSLAGWAASRIDPTLREPDRLMSLEELEDRPPRAEDHAAWWGSWLGREEAFYLRAAELVGALGRSELDGILTDHGKRRLPVVEQRLDRVATPLLPDELVLAADVHIEPSAGPMASSLPVRVTAYSQYDPLSLSAATASALDAFSSPRPASAAVAVFGEELAQLMRWRILVAPGKSTDI